MRGLCHWCGKDIALRIDGTARRHRAEPDEGRWWCNGSNAAPGSFTNVPAVMKVDRDNAAGALYVTLSQGVVARTLELSDSVMVDIDATGRAVGVEILGLPTCHCGRLLAYGFDGDPTHHRGMCEDCDAVRCDVDPSQCPYRATLAAPVPVVGEAL